jgi:hypothetical protein
MIRQLSTVAEGFDAGATTFPALVAPEEGEGAILVAPEEGELDEENGFFNKNGDVSAAPTLLMQNMQHTKVTNSIAATYRVLLYVIITIDLL